MKRLIGAVMVVAMSAALSVCFAVDKFTYSWTPHAGDTVTSAKMKMNYDSIKAGADRVVDTVNWMNRSNTITSITCALLESNSRDTLVANISVTSFITKEGIQALTFDGGCCTLTSDTTIEAILSIPDTLLPSISTVVPVVISVNNGSDGYDMAASGLLIRGTGLDIMVTLPSTTISYVKHQTIFYLMP